MGCDAATSSSRARKTSRQVLGSGAMREGRMPSSRRAETGLAPRATPSLKMEVGLNISELGVRACRVDAFYHALAPCVCVIGGHTESVAEGHVHAHVPNVGQASVAAAGTASVAKRVRLECATSAIPKVVRIRQTQPM